MKPGQIMAGWWQQYVAGRLRTPQALYAAADAERRAPVEDRFTQVPEPSPRWDAPKRLAAPGFLLSEPHIRQGYRADWQQTDYRLMKWAGMVVLDARKWDIPLYVHSAFRTREQQEELLARRVSKVGWPRSAHNIGEAVDIVHGVYHWDLTQDEWLFIHRLGLDALRRLNAQLAVKDKLALNWGGDDGTPDDTFRWDPAHWETADFRKRTRKLAAGAPVHLSPKRLVAS